MYCIMVMILVVAEAVVVVVVVVMMVNIVGGRNVFGSYRDYCGSQVKFILVHSG